MVAVDVTITSGIIVENTLSAAKKNQEKVNAHLEKQRKSTLTHLTADGGSFGTWSPNLSIIQ